MPFARSFLIILSCILIISLLVDERIGSRYGIPAVDFNIMFLSFSVSCVFILFASREAIVPPFFLPNGSVTPI